MFGISGTELIIISILALVLIGPDELVAASRPVRSFLEDSGDAWWMPVAALVVLAVYVGIAVTHPTGLR